MSFSFRRGPLVVLFGLTVAAAAQGAPLAPPKPLPGPVGPAVPRPAPLAADCLSAASDGSVGIGADATGTSSITPRNHDRDCPGSVIVDYTINPEAARPTTPTGAPNVSWSPAVGLGVSDSRESLVGESYLVVTGARSAKACEDFKHTQKVYRRAQNETAWTLAAEGTSSSSWEPALTRCLLRRANHSFRAPPPPPAQKVYYRTVDTLPGGPSGNVTVKWHHDRETNHAP